MIPFQLSLGDFSPVIRRIDGDGEARDPAIALTFDDGPDPASTPHLIDALAAAGARATFFLCGVRVERHPEQVHALVAAGHEVYAHGWDHRRYGSDEADAAAAATARTEALLARHRPTPQTYLVRLPFNAGYNSAATHRAMRRFHSDVQFAWWSHAIADYLIADAVRPETELRLACADAIARLDRCRDLAGGVLLLHDAAITQPQAAAVPVTRMLLPGVLQALARRGISGVGLKPRRRHSRLERFAFRSPQPVTIRPDLSPSA